MLAKAAVSLPLLQKIFVMVQMPIEIFYALSMYIASVSASPLPYASPASYDTVALRRNQIVADRKRSADGLQQWAGRQAAKMRSRYGSTEESSLARRQSSVELRNLNLDR